LKAFNLYNEKDIIGLNKNSEKVDDIIEEINSERL